MKKPMTPDQQDLASKNMSLVYSMIIRKTRLRPGHIDWDDTVSAGMEGLCNAALSYNRQVEFSTWACRLILQSISSHHRKQLKHGFRCAPDVVSCPLSAEMTATKGSTPIRDSLVARPEGDPTFEDKELHRRVERAVQSLPDRERAIVRELFYAGLDHRRVGKKMGISKQWVRVLREKALATLRERV